ncbi:FAD-dependent oxidoreductase [Actinocrispum sp. NPDC049592]|uniref:NAD(P)/FAD-dependent oxidoreductase n=1 Tax=Actinocrispum sp. NPDC049592 TaxID=3154835 RepID=UPI0034448253
MTELERIVIVGAGVAGLRAAERLRELDYDGEVVIIGDEPRWPYHRPLVSKDLLAGSDRPSDLTLQRHVETGARWRLGTRAERLDTQRKVVGLPGGEEIKYDGLIIATGVEPRHMKGVPRHSPRVHTLRTVDEAMALKKTIHDNDLPIVVLGTGYIGCDVAASSRKMGRDVTMVGRSRFPLKALGNEVASAVDHLHRKHRVRMAMNTDIRNWVVSDDNIAMHTTDGQLLVAGAVVLAIGSIPSVDWARGSGLILEDGILCDAQLFAAGADNVVVAGDCGRWPNLRFSETPRRVEHWINAVEMGRAAAENLLVGREKATPFTPIPRVWSGQYGMRLQIAGVPALGKDVVHLEDGVPGTPGITGYVRDGKLVGVCGWDAPRKMIKWTEELHKLLPVPEKAKRPVAPAPAAANSRPPAPPVRQEVPTAPVRQQSMPLPVPAMAGAPMNSMEMTVVQPGAMGRPPMPSMPMQRPVATPSMRMRPVPPPAPANPPVAPAARGAMNSMPMSRPAPAGPPPRRVPPALARPAAATGGGGGRHSKPAGPTGRPPMPSMPMARPQLPEPEPMTTQIPPIRDEPMSINSEFARMVREEAARERASVPEYRGRRRREDREVSVQPPSAPATGSIPNLSAPNLSMSNLAMPKIPVPDPTPSARMRPAPPPARQRRAEASQALPPVPPPLPGQHPSFPNMRPVARPDEMPSFSSMPPVPPPTGRYQEHPSFPNMRAVPPPPQGRYQEHPSFPNMQAVPRPPQGGRYQEHPSFPSMQAVERPERESRRLTSRGAVRGFG